MKTISVKNQIALVDDEYFDCLSIFHWEITNVGYLRTVYISKKQKEEFLKLTGIDLDLYIPNKNRELMHRLVMLLDLHKNPGLYVDHINRNRLDNRKSNLRLVTAAQSSANALKQKRMLFRGVEKQHNKYRARISHHYKNHMATFDDAILAAKYYDFLSTTYHGVYGITNHSMGLVDQPNKEELEMFKKILKGSK